MRPRRFHTPLALTAGVLIVLIALLAAGSLRLLFQLYERYLRSAATSSALQYGTLLARRLAQEEYLALAPVSPESLEEFRRLAASLHKLDRRLEYVTVQEDDLVLYHWQAPLVAAPPDSAAGPGGGRIVVSPRRLHLGARTEDVLDFSRPLGADDAAGRRLRVGLQKEILEREQQELLAALTAMFRFAMIMLAVAFGVCLLAVLVLVWREMRWINRRAVEGHLAFAGAVAGAVIHDFRNPMSAMRLDAQLLEQEAGRGAAARADKLGELAGRVARTLARMDEILREFLALSCPDRPGPELFDLNAAAADCADLLKLRFERADIRLETACAPEKMTVQGNTTQFKRALLNVLNNAVQFAPAGSRVVVLTARHGRQGEVSVADEGPGIPAAERKRVFEMYYGRRPGGTGLGLALARAAVMNCGGRIILTDLPEGHGCRVVIRLPLADA